MDRARPLVDWLARRCENVLALLLASMFVAFILQIVFRYVLGWSVGWTIEWVTISWVWCILFGYAFVVRDEDVIRLDIVYLAVPRPVRRAFDVFAGLGCAGIFAYTLPAAWDYIDFMARERTAYMRWPFNLVFSIYMGFALSVILRALLTAWNGLMGRGPWASAASAPEHHDHA
ncbi:TRAP transporter small permease [Anianabacter salinae]|uniref:TRAP transporter small permease n=1 Tax=Anianabacter salinae TaxID=2851023 RepID=UPI00225E2336|nr:TRAP transporter small permease subunit [Anianabacter salinae]MBV0912062.1 TRAP transporter small permease subunit [Anianabacter salinae]